MRRLIPRSLALTVLAALAAAVFLHPSPPPLAAAEPELPADLAMVPGDAAGFVHIRAADLWKHEMMRGLRDTIAQAGPKALASFEKQVYPSPSTIDRITAFVIAPPGDRGKGIVVGVVRFTEAFDKDKLLKQYLPGAKTVTVADKTMYSGTDGDMALSFPDDKHVLVGTGFMLRDYLARPPMPKGGLTPAVETAAKGMAIVAAVNVSAIPLPPNAFRDVPEPLLPLVKAERVTLTLDAKAAAPVLTLRAAYAGDQAAADAQTATKEAAKMAKALLTQSKSVFEKALAAKADNGPRPVNELPELFGSLVGLGGMNQMDKMLDDLPITRDGNDLTASVTIPKEYNQLAAYYPLALGMLLPAVQKTREAAGRMKSSNNLKQIGLAFHIAHDNGQQFPTNIYSKDGKPLLSWRVAILPYIEQQQLYNRFKLDEPWDSDNNKKLLPLMPQTYMVPNATKPEEGKTFYQGFVGKKGVSPRPFFVDDSTVKTTFANVTDGLSNSVLVVEAAEAVEWAKPADLPFDPKGKLPQLGGHAAGGFNALLGDGSVRFIRSTIADVALRALITIDGGEVVDVN